MNDKRREILIGYLLGSLEPEESAKIDTELQTNAVLRDDLATLYREISPINEMVDHHEPPADLAKRTCHNLWARIDSEQNSTSLSRDARKKRRITAVVTQVATAQEVVTQRDCLREETPLPPQELNPDAVIPLSKALQYGASGKPRKAHEVSRRVDPAENSPGEPHLYLDSMIIVKNSPPKYYGQDKQEEKVKTPWKMRDIVASLLVGLAVAIVAFPVVNYGIGGFRAMITRKKIENVAKTVPPSSSQSPLYGATQRDIRMLSSVNIDPQSAGTLQNQRNNAHSSIVGE